MPKDYFETRFTFDKKRQVVWKEIARYLQQYVSPESTLLELGAGYCDFINQIQCQKKYAVDLSEQLDHFAAKDVILMQQSVTCLEGVDDVSVDLVFSSNLFEHLTRAEFEQCIAEVRRVLRYEGKLIIIQPNFKYCYDSYFDDFTHKLPFTHVTMQDWLKFLGFEVEQVRPRFLPFSMKSRLPTSGWLVWLFLRIPPNPLGKQFLIVARKTTQ